MTAPILAKPDLTGLRADNMRRHKLCIPKVRWMISRRHKRLAIACLIASTLAAPSGPDRARADQWIGVPFTRTDSAGTPLNTSPNGRRFAYANPDGSTGIALPDYFVPQARLPLRGEQVLVLGRIAVSGTLAAVLLDKRVATPLRIEPRLAEKLYFFHGFVAFGKPFLLAYDVEETMPSGRSNKIVKDGVDLFLLEISGDGLRLEKRADKLGLAGIDARFIDQQVGNDHLLCAQAACLLLSRNDAGYISQKELRRPEWGPRSLVEFNGDPRSLRGLFRLDVDDRFRAPAVAGEVTYMDCGIWPDGGCHDVPDGQIPMGYRADGALSGVATCADVESVMRKDLASMPGHGQTYLGMNNLEGRIAWGQVYVLDGMLDVIEGLALPQWRFNTLRQEMRQRVGIELAWWSVLTKTDNPWLWSRRYSIERADIVSVVHIGRMARVAARAEMLGMPVPPGLTATLAGILRSPDRTIEEIRGQQILFRKGGAFHLDGSNAPWNIQSGWIEGLAALARTTVFDDVTRLAAIAMIFDFVRVEIAAKMPDLWQYCTGKCLQGWKASDNISVNTPDWEGNKTRTSTAHVSYRTMDARAVLDAMAVWKLEGLEWFPRYISGLVERGWLYPMAKAPLAHHGLRPRLSVGTVGRFGRSAIPFDFHNQVWALDQSAARDDRCE